MEVLELERKRISKQEIAPAKSKTQLLLEKMERGEYVSDDEYLGSIPGFLEALDKEANDPNAEWIPIEDVWPEWNNA
ncbi:MAG: hypothetical protein FWG85_01950 [Bacteroidetes bacterium]|nr:hypothetical protein [Bacteroidota bacterium]